MKTKGCFCFALEIQKDLVRLFSSTTKLHRIYNIKDSQVKYGETCYASP